MKKNQSIILMLIFAVAIATPVVFADDAQQWKSDKNHYYNIMATLENARKELRQISTGFPGEAKREEVSDKIKNAMDELASTLPDKK